MIADPELRDAGCGTIDYDVVWDPDIPLGQDVFTVDLGGNLPSVVVDASDPILVANSPLKLKIKATLSRDQLGTIDSKESEPLAIEFSNTCLDTQLIAKNIPTITARLN